MEKKGVSRCLATFFYVGYLPKAPGTWGSLATIPLIVFLHNDIVYAAVVVALIIVGTYVSQQMSVVEGVSDPKEVVIDEVAGMMITMFLIPVSIFSLVMGLALFRFFDIFKPWLVGKAEKLPGGYGIMLDDIVAGLFANILLQCMFTLTL